MRFAMILILSAVLQAQNATPPKSAPAGNADNGRRLFEDVGCYQCHGHQAQGGSAGARLAPRPIPFAAFAKYVRQPANQMPPYTAKVLPDSSLADIYAFLESIPQPAPAKSIPLLNH
jgi:mono/diheme cytochrome c family protein